MNIKIADRLVKLRKEKGLSQEELADKLGLSRQAVSKWERAEASPDIDNLICLSKLYGVSLDALLQDDDDIETIVEEQVKSKELSCEDKIKSQVHIGKDGIHIVDEDDEVHINRSGIHVIENGKDVDLSSGKVTQEKRDILTPILSATSAFLALIALVLIGTLVPNGWTWSWTFLLLIPVFSTIGICIKDRQLSPFCYPLLVTFIYCFVCLAITPIWHPLWVVFVTIPIFYSIASPIDNYKKSKRKIVIENKD